MWTFELALPVAKFEARKRILEDVAVTKKGAEAAIALAALLPAGGKKATGLLGESLAIGASAALDRSSDSWSQIVFDTLSKLWLIFKFWGWSSVGCRGKIPCAVSSCVLQGCGSSAHVCKMLNATFKAGRLRGHPQLCA